MSFTFNWPRFSDQFHYDAIQMINTALNKGNKPPIIVDKIEVVELEMGSQAPELEIRDIGDLTMDQFRGIFRLTYAGDAHLVLKTKVQANPLNHKQPDPNLIAGARGMLAAKQPLVVPMLLRLSHFKLNSVVVLVVSKQKGITLVFKTDPLQSVDISSTFDSIAVIKNLIQREIEGQLRQMFREDLPGIIHRLSQQWIKAKVDDPMHPKQPVAPPPTPIPSHSSRPQFDTRSSPDIPSHFSPPHMQSPNPLTYRRTQSTSGISVASTSRRPTISHRPASVASPAPAPETSFPDLENFDPTYGLRPEGLPSKSLFRGFSSLFTPNKGLADLTEEPADPGDYEDDTVSFDFLDWNDSVAAVSPTQSTYGGTQTEYESIPAVGGGHITRPRIYHSQSQSTTASSSMGTISPSTPLFSRQPSRSYERLFSPGSAGLMSSSSFSSPGLGLRNPYFSEFARGINSRFHHGPMLSGTSSFSEFSPSPYFPEDITRPVSPDSIETRVSQGSDNTRSIPTPPPQSEDDTSDAQIYIRRASQHNNSNLDDAFRSVDHDDYEHDTPPPKIVLRPSLNNSIHHLSTLSHSTHTLSPYTRSLQHFTVRSGPPRVTGSDAVPERQPVKAKRRRMYRIGGSKKTSPEILTTPPSPSIRRTSSSPVPTGSELDFDVDDMNRYFRSFDEPPNINTTHMRRRPIG